MRTDMYVKQKLVHAFTHGIDSALRCPRTILSRTLNSARHNISVNAIYTCRAEAARSRSKRGAWNDCATRIKRENFKPTPIRFPRHLYLENVSRRLSYGSVRKSADGRENCCLRTVLQLLKIKEKIKKGTDFSSIKKKLIIEKLSGIKRGEIYKLMSFRITIFNNKIKCHRLNSYVNYNCELVNCITFLYKYKRTRSQRRVFAYPAEDNSLECPTRDSFEFSCFSHTRPA
ncbi:hypothetical protein PUN28_005688 [Cardiocondyla obscurior]|uniref:Uncharacterized protein n=1 Tax=Cardiocondyla obscurior TaxID=286306 RepID=A0AAW2G775_9HYME